eukprot:2142468-Amphidinium_carterae.1
MRSFPFFSNHGFEIHDGHKDDAGVESESSGMSSHAAFDNRNWTKQYLNSGDNPEVLTGRRTQSQRRAEVPKPPSIRQHRCCQSFANCLGELNTSSVHLCDRCCTLVGTVVSLAI